MAHYNIIYACSHTDRINIVGPHRSRASRIAFLESGPCFECYKDEKHQSAREQAEALDLPQLVGSEKQIAWAETVRVSILTKIDAEMEALEARSDPNRSRPPAELDAERQVMHALAVISSETSARWWIDHRSDSPSQLIREVARAEMRTPSAAERQVAQAAQQRAEADKTLVLTAATVRPEHPVTATVAEIHIASKIISVHFPEKREDFREIVKSLGYAWTDGRWQRAIGAFSGIPTDRAAELGHTLLMAGFVICILDDALRAAAVDGTYVPECTRWVRKVGAGDHAGWFAIVWAWGEDFYSAARRIPGSRYDAPLVVVPPEQFEQVLDFATRYDFQVSNRAQEVVVLARAAKEQMLVVQPAPKRKASKAHAPGDVPPVLMVPESVEVAPELRDD